MKVIGTAQITDVYHGSAERFERFEDSKLRSLGFHFGDIDQARHFAGAGGFIYRVDLRFVNLVDIGKQDWGWTSIQFIAFAFFMSCLMSKIPTAHEDFEPFLGPRPWSAVSLKRTSCLSAEEQKQLVALFRSYDFDGAQYVNMFEPPAKPGGTAYFALNADQISLREVQNA